MTRFAAAIAVRINRGSTLRNSAKAGAGGAKAGFASLKTGSSRPAALYAALTLSRTSTEIDAGKGPALGKMAAPCMHAGKAMKNKGEVGMNGLGVLLVATGIMVGSAQAQEKTTEKINPTDPQPTCPMCPGTYIPASELEAYTKKALDEKLLDQQVRDIDIGKAHIGLGMIHRSRWSGRRRDDIRVAYRSNMESEDRNFHEKI